MLSLGELSASKLVETAASPTFADILFSKMHYGMANDLAAYCLVAAGRGDRGDAGAGDARSSL